MRAAVIGVGHLGRHHARILASLPGITLAGVVDTNRERAGQVAAEHGTQLPGADVHGVAVQPLETLVERWSKARRVLDLHGEGLSYRCNVGLSKNTVMDIVRRDATGHGL